MFSVAKSTSIAALHRITCIPPLLHRNVELQARYFARLHNNQDSDIPAVKLYWKMKQSEISNESLINNLNKKNYLFGKASLINQVGRMFGQALPIVGFTKKILKEARLNAILDMNKENSTNVAAMVEVNKNLVLSHLLKRNNLRRNVQRRIILWKLGRIAYHQVCACGEEASRKHVVICSGADVYLMKHKLIGDCKDSKGCNNVLDLAMVGMKFEKAEDDQATKIISGAIKKIMKKCLKYGIEDAENENASGVG
jgi:hypothetical protein